MSSKSGLTYASMGLTLLMPAVSLGHSIDKHDEAAFARFPAGVPGAPEKAMRIVNVKMSDAMRYAPTRFEFRSGETVRFIITNEGQVRHEFGIGTIEEQRAHEEMMKADPEMRHEDTAVLSVEPGETKRLVWQFGNPGEYELACHVPGHYPAGMKAKIIVRKR